MQNTRLNNLINFGISRLRIWLFNPWRKISIWIIGLLFGFFLGTAVSTVAGQMAQLDIVAAALLLTIVEIINRLVYGRNRPTIDDTRLTNITSDFPNLGVVEISRRNFGLEVLNATKVGFVYSLFVEALKLGS